jgi:hypothetical protein
MVKRLQVLLDEAELRAIQRLARHRGITLADWVRQALRAAYQREPKADPDTKLARVHAALRHDFPAPDIDQMLAEIAAGYRLDPEA